jgi:hypothetical protein
MADLVAQEIKSQEEASGIIREPLFQTGHKLAD